MPDVEELLQQSAYEPHAGPDPDSIHRRAAALRRRRRTLAGAIPLALAVLVVVGLNAANEATSPEGSVRTDVADDHVLPEIPEIPPTTLAVEPTTTTSADPAPESTEEPTEDDGRTSEERAPVPAADPPAAQESSVLSWTDEVGDARAEDLLLGETENQPYVDVVSTTMRVVDGRALRIEVTLDDLTPEPPRGESGLAVEVNFTYTRDGRQNSIPIDMQRYNDAEFIRISHPGISGCPDCAIDFDFDLSRVVADIPLATLDVMLTSDGSVEAADAADHIRDPWVRTWTVRTDRTASSCRDQENWTGCDGTYSSTPYDLSRSSGRLALPQKST